MAHGEFSASKTEPQRVGTDRPTMAPPQGGNGASTPAPPNFFGQTIWGCLGQGQTRDGVTNDDDKSDSRPERRPAGLQQGMRGVRARELALSHGQASWLDWGQSGFSLQVDNSLHLMGCRGQWHLCASRFRNRLACGVVEKGIHPKQQCGPQDRKYPTRSWAAALWLAST